MSTQIRFFYRRLPVLILAVLMTGLLIPAHTRAQSDVCPGFSLEQEVTFGEVLQERIDPILVVWYYFYAEADTLVTLDIISNGSFGQTFSIVPDSAPLMWTNNSHAIRWSDFGFEGRSTAINIYEEGYYCMIVNALDNPDQRSVPFAFSMNRITPDQNNRFLNEDRYDAFAQNAFGNYLYDQREHADAIYYYERALEQLPGDYVIWTNLAWAQLFARDIEAAQQSADVVLAYESDYRDGLQLKGYIDLLLGDYDGAYNAYFSIPNRDDIDFYWLGLAQLGRGNNIRADAELRFVDSPTAFVYIWRAYLADLDGDTERADSYREEAFELGEESGRIFSIRALDALQRGDLDAAREHYEAILERDNSFRSSAGSVIYLRLFSEIDPDSYTDIYEWFLDELQ